VVSIEEARTISSEANLDLVEISPNAEPPVCRIMDYGKFRFEESKKLQTAKKKQKQTQVKEIKFRPGTDIGDYNIKLRKLVSFLEDGDRTKVTLRFRGRERPRGIRYRRTGTKDGRAPDGDGAGAEAKQVAMPGV